jgi:Gram-negative bacterial TonB protein C-terminal
MFRKCGARLCLWLLPLIFAAAAMGADSVAGSWINENHGTGGVTRLVLRSDAQQLFVRAWGACSPRDCDWGEVLCPPHGAGCKATWEHGFATTSMQLLPLADGRLQIKYKADFHDHSGRHDNGSEEFFVRGDPPQLTGNSIRNLSPEEAGKRISQCVSPIYPDSQVRPLVLGTVEIGLLISPAGNVIDGTRFLGGPTLFRDSAMQAVRKWKFKADLGDAQPTLMRVRVLIRYRADMTTEVALAPAILPDSFGNQGTPRNQETEAALPPLKCDN